jgi:hypothetical protein
MVNQESDRSIATKDLSANPLKDLYSHRPTEESYSNSSGHSRAE